VKANTGKLTSRDVRSELALMVAGEEKSNNEKRREEDEQDEAVISSFRTDEVDLAKARKAKTAPT
jgi:hypothetical protein